MQPMPLSVVASGRNRKCKYDHVTCRRRSGPTAGRDARRSAIGRRESREREPGGGGLFRLDVGRAGLVSLPFVQYDRLPQDVS